ncbi:ABC transporter permease subunit [Allofranklinella schreckenbergeri]|uniref:ABC transporter permease subunit n=1 Tax=Allofranklinella schreckenbergeri TaxID=1076744 RepID=A0A3M6R285_9BURK|nr:ABC transporter permease subunit [Allofranklinella schreckenbergeri]RMX09398.1 ABC transporter permease subunit [Allofranklinella schreckenbergeri]
MLESLALLGFGTGGWGGALLSGALVTIALAVACVPIGMPLGLLLALAARSPKRLPRMVSTAFSTVFRGLPELLTLLLVYYGVQIAAQRMLDSLGYEGQFSINAFLAAVVAFSLVLAAFSSEVWLAALKTIPKGQREAAQALGLSRGTTFRRVVFPQLMRVALPGLSNNWLTLLKDSSLVSTISLVDLMRQTNLAVAATKEPVLFYLAACLLYLLLSALSGLVFTKAEHHYSRHHQEARA